GKLARTGVSATMSLGALQSGLEGFSIATWVAADSDGKQEILSKLFHRRRQIKMVVKAAGNRFDRTISAFIMEEQVEAVHDNNKRGAPNAPPAIPSTPVKLAQRRGDQ
ncbi:unnamed protein product, partial [Closterium sp. Naga37s-1]